MKIIFANFYKGSFSGIHFFTLLWKLEVNLYFDTLRVLYPKFWDQGKMLYEYPNLQNLALVLFTENLCQSSQGLYSICKTSFITPGAIPTFTFNISVTNFCKFLCWIVKALFSLVDQWKMLCNLGKQVVKLSRVC